LLKRKRRFGVEEVRGGGTIQATCINLLLIVEAVSVAWLNAPDANIMLSFEIEQI